MAEVATEETMAEVVKEAVLPRLLLRLRLVALHPAEVRVRVGSDREVMAKEDMAEMVKDTAGEVTEKVVMQVTV